MSVKKAATKNSHEVPRMRDSDVLYLMAKRIEQAAGKMTRFEYDQELEDLMDETAEMFAWLAEHIANREAAK